MGEIVVRTEPRKLFIEKADEEIEISLALWVWADFPEIQVHTGDGMTWISFHTENRDLSYEILGLNSAHGTLHCRKIYDSRHAEADPGHAQTEDAQGSDAAQEDASAQPADRAAL